MKSHLTQFLLELLAIPSPTGHTEAALVHTETALDRLGIKHKRTKKGALIWEIPARNMPHERHITFSAHIDTLGAMVKEIRSNGRLGIHRLGGYDWTSIEGEEVTVHTQSGLEITGTVVNTKQSTHVHGAALRELKRDASNMEIRLDERTSSEDETKQLGIAVGDFVSLSAHPRLTPAGYIKSRHIDNKAAVAVFLAATELLATLPQHHAITFHISHYEEVGHGAATGIPSHTDELIAVDMAAVGDGQTSSEHHVTLCVADSTGPYDEHLGRKLREAARRANLDLKVDIYPYYGSDGSAAWAAGGDYPVALIGPGVDASHAYERTHLDALDATAQLILSHVAHP